MLEQDGDGHRYVIPVYLQVEFDQLVDEADDEAFMDKFEQYRLDGGTLTFTDPKVS